MTRTMEVIDRKSGVVIDTVKLDSSGGVKYDTNKAKRMVEAVKRRENGTLEQAFLLLWDTSNGYVVFKGVN